MIGANVGVGAGSEGRGPRTAAETLFSRYATPPSDWYRDLVTSQIAALQAAGVYSKYDALYVAYAESEADSHLDWSPHARDFNDIRGNPGWSGTGGWTFNGTSDSLIYNIDPDELPNLGFKLDDAFLGAKFLTGVANAGATASNDAGNPNSRIGRAASGTQDNVRANRNANSNSTTVAAADKLWTRDGSASWRYYIDGVINGANPRTDVSTGLTMTRMGIGSLTIGTWGVNTVSLFRWGSHLTPAEVVAEHALWVSFISDFTAGP